MRKTTPLSTAIESAQVWANQDQYTCIVWQNDEGSYWCSRQGASAPSGRGCWRVVCRVDPEPAKPPSEHAELLKDARGLAEHKVQVGQGCTAAMLRNLADALESHATSQPELVAACKTADKAITELVSYRCIPFKANSVFYSRMDAARHLCRRAHENAPKGGGA